MYWRLVKYYGGNFSTVTLKMLLVEVFEWLGMLCSASHKIVTSGLLSRNV
jgi:hypothetical protein